MPIQGKALFLMLESSGMRIGEALQLKLGDVHLESDPVMVEIRGDYTKSGNPRRAFISSEAKESIEEWLKSIEEYLEQAVRKSKRRPQYKGEFKGKTLDDDRLFPFQNNTAYAIWSNALKKGRFKQRDASTNRHKIHPHVLRKFFRTKMGSVIPVDVTEALMGHEGYLTEVYRRYSVEDLAKFYKQGEPALLIFGGDTLRYTNLKKETEGLHFSVERIRTENKELREKIGEMEETIRPFAELYKKMEEVFGDEAEEYLKDLFLASMSAVEDLRHTKMYKEQE